MTLLRSPSMFTLSLTAFMLLASAQVSVAESPQQAQKFKAEISVGLNYLLSLPEGYEQKDSWPLLIFLHGSGERGNDLELVKKHGPPKLIDAGKEFPFIVVSPQCPMFQRWQVSILDALLNDLQTKLKVDHKRIYLTGLSLGGYGTWDWATYAPDRFAAIVPICGRGDRKGGPRLAKIPTWVFHGAQDTAVPLSASEKMVSAIRKAGGDPLFTIYPDAAHDSWTETYENPEVYDWLLKHSK